MTDWDQCYREGRTPWDKGAPAPPLVEYLRENVVSGRVVVPGCGLGHDARAIALASADAEVLGVDLAGTAIAGAEALENPDGLGFVQADFFGMADGELAGTFDWVFEHTCISGIDPSMRAAYADAVCALLKPGGRYLAILFLTPWDEGETPEPPPFGISLEEVDAMFGERLVLEREWEPTAFYEGREGREMMRVMRKPSAG